MSRAATLASPAHDIKDRRLSGQNRLIIGRRLREPRTAAVARDIHASIGRPNFSWADFEPSKRFHELQ